jgi:Clp amino terminal domain, pathogenicity island component
MTRRRQPGDYHPWTTYIYAREEARRRGDRKVGTDHLVLGLLHEPALVEALACDLRAARDALDTLDRRALSAVGIGADIDLELLLPTRPGNQPAKPTLKAILHDHLPMSPAAKTALRESSKGMRRGQYVPPQLVMLALLDLEPPDPAAALFDELGIDRASARARLDEASAAA